MEALSRRPECALIYCLAGVLETVTTNDTFTRRLNRTVMEPPKGKAKKKAQRPIHTKMSFLFRILGAFSKLQYSFLTDATTKYCKKIIFDRKNIYRTDRSTNQPTNQPTNGRTKPLIESLVCD